MKLNEKFEQYKIQFEQYKTQIGAVVCILLVFSAGFLWGSYVGYDRGMNDVPAPEYTIQTVAIELNYTLYNMTYYVWTRPDAPSDNWVLDLEPRDDYFMIGISIVAQSENWTRFWLWIDSSVLGNTTIELVHVVTYYQSGGTHVYNWYDTQIGGLTCSDRADIAFLGYGDFEGLDTSISRTVRIKGLFN